jgi:hypothetical protein
VIAERQSRTVPAARMIVSASTASTKHARNTAMKSADPVTTYLTSDEEERIDLAVLVQWCRP